MTEKNLWFGCGGSFVDFVGSIAWWFKQFCSNLSVRAQSDEAAKMSSEAVRNRLPGLPTFFIATPYSCITYLGNLMTGFVDHIKAANQSADHNRKLSTWQGKVTVILQSLSKQYYLMRCLRDSGFPSLQGLSSNLTSFCFACQKN